jgi:hypothetical protein
MQRGITSAPQMIRVSCGIPDKTCYYFGAPRPDDIIVRLRYLAGKYLCDTHTLSDLGTPFRHAYHELAA